MADEPIQVAEQVVATTESMMEAVDDEEDMAPTAEEEQQASGRSVSWADNRATTEENTTTNESTDNLPLSEYEEMDSVAIMCETALLGTSTNTASNSVDSRVAVPSLEAAATSSAQLVDTDGSNKEEEEVLEEEEEMSERNGHDDDDVDDALEVDVDEVSTTGFLPPTEPSTDTLCAVVSLADVSVDDSYEEEGGSLDHGHVVADIAAANNNNNGEDELEEVMAEESTSNNNNDNNTDEAVHAVMSSSSTGSSSRCRAFSEDSASLLLSLPMDSLHCIASFLTPTEWSNYGQSCTLASKVCREIFRRVRMHAFKCATEVITAWKLEQQADARELAALYISSGVPIYPHSLGHSYHTLSWKMGIEAKEYQEKVAAAAAAEAGEGNNNGEDNAVADDDDRNNNDNNQSNPVDRFYSDRFTTFRVRDGSSPIGSYLEEKCLYWLGPHSPLNQHHLGSMGRGRRSSTGVLGQPIPPRGEHGHAPPIPPPLGLADRAATVGRNNPSPPASPPRSLSQSDLSTISPSRSPYVSKKMLIRVHRHLLDRHLLGRGSVDDGENSLITPPVSLSADFFHPHLVTLGSMEDRLPSSPMQNTPPPRRTMNTTPLRNGQPAEPPSLVDPSIAVAAAPSTAVREGEQESTPPVAAEDLARSVDTEPANDPTRLPVEALSDEADPAVALVPPNPPIPQVPRQPESPASAASHDPWLAMMPRSPHLSILNYVDLDVYSASSANPKWKDGTSEMKRHLRARFDVYKGRLEVLLLHGDSSGFEECMLDFWDEFLPQTANIHYFDKHTAVPRISNLQRFLTTPCPKALGVVQCEIERIKLSPAKRKGMNMKGRLFPTYEYRLFIRDREHGKQNQGDPDNADESEEDAGIRRDTVLMIAKNRGRKHVDTSGVVPMAASKKGANNYYLHLPQQTDVDAHFSKANEAEPPSSGNPNGVSPYTVQSSTEESRAPVLLGRLQSNFIGTEFQIFTPRARKQPPAGKPVHQRSASLGTVPNPYEDELDYDSGAASDSASSASRRRGRFGRLTLRRSSSNGDPVALPERPSSPSWMRSRPRSDGAGSRTPRTNRRAIANEAIPDDENESVSRARKPVLMEEEDGAITYTANLLGSRPRIMDVCVPKVSPDGCAGYDWRRYLENNNDVDDLAPHNRMLNCFKQLQQQLENQEMIGDDDESNVGRESTEDYGLLALQNRPPWWNIELGSFVLNFRGRVSVASVKNFQLCDRNDHDHIMLQFGRIHGRHSFTMDFQYPLTAVQAFSIAISSLQSKISFG